MDNKGKTVNILGTDYMILQKQYCDEEAFARRSICGYCNGLTKQIVYCDMSTYKCWEYEAPETIEAAQKETLRHEIVHAFFNESGLADNSFIFDGAWAKNEELVDWIALQGPKLWEAWQIAGAL